MCIRDSTRETSDHTIFRVTLGCLRQKRAIWRTEFSFSKARHKHRRADSAHRATSEKRKTMEEKNKVRMRKNILSACFSVIYF